MSRITLEAEVRTDLGKGASRRLRRLENKIPAIVYGQGKDPQTVNLLHNKVIKALENENIYSSILDLKIGKHKEQVILKDMQRHPYKPIIMHMDLQRISETEQLVAQIPLHFINEDKAKGAKAGGIITHSLHQVEVKCQAKHLPAFIEVDMADVELDQTLHLSDLVLPAKVELTTDLSEEQYNQAVVSIITPKVVVEEKVEEEKVEPEAEDKAEPESEV